MSPGETSELARAVQEVSERASLLIREEIELAKAEISTKVSKLAKGAAIGAAAGVFLITALLYLLHAAAWGTWSLLQGDTYDIWWGYLIVAGALILLGALAGFIAYRLVRKGSPPVPNMAIEEAHLIRDTVSSSSEPGRASV